MGEQGCPGCSLWEHRAVWALGKGGNAVPCPLNHGLQPNAGLSLKAETSESQCWGQDGALIIKSPSKKS